MKRLSLILILLCLSFISIKGNVTNTSGNYRRFIELEKWDQSSRSAIPISVESYLPDNHIEVHFIGHSEIPVILQIKDAQGNSMFQNNEINRKQETLKIDIEHLSLGSYEFNYSDRGNLLKGKF